MTATPIYIQGVPIVGDALQSLCKLHQQIYLERTRTDLGVTSFPIAVEVLDPTETGDADATVPVLLASYAAATETDLIVMTTHGRSGLARFWLGSVADALVRASRVPVLSVCPNEAASPAEQPPLIERLVIALDGSAQAERILAPALALGDLVQARYTLVMVLEPSILSGYTPHAQTQHYLHRLVRRLATNGRSVDTRIWFGRHAAEAIVAEARKHGGDVVALATHARGGLARLLLGNLADQVRRGTGLPVLVYHPGEPDESAGRRITATPALTLDEHSMLQVASSAQTRSLV
jgi:nucleotide-binding universal stress UspA family protein